MPILELDDSEVETLRVALDARIAGLLAEIHHADARAFRAALRRQCDQLERLAARLPRAVTPGELQDAMPSRERA